MACFKLLKTRSFWVLQMLLNKDFIHVSILMQSLQISGNRLMNNHEQRSTSHREPSTGESNKPIASKTLLCLNRNDKTQSNIEQTKMLLKCRRNGSINDFSTIPDQSENDFTKHLIASGASSTSPAVKDITVNDFGNGSSIAFKNSSSMSTPVTDIIVNNVEEAHSTPSSVTDINLNDLTETSSIPPSAN